MNNLAKSVIRKSLLAVFLIPFIVSCGGGGKKGAARMRARHRVKPYPVLQVQRRSVVLTTSYPTHLEGSQTVEIRPRVSGYIVDIPVSEGDIVEKGQVLFQLQKDRFQQKVRAAKADVLAAKAAVQTAKDDVQRIRNLVEQNIVSKYKLQAAKDKLKMKKAKLAQAQAALKNAKTNLSYTTIRSPVSGAIGNIPHRVGSLVSSTLKKPLTVVSDNTPMFAYFSISEQQLLTFSRQAIGEGGAETVQERVAAMPNAHLILSDSTFYDYEGEIQLASGHINNRTGTALLKAIFPNPNELLRSGATGEIRIPLALDSVIVIPKRATYQIQAKRYVYTVTDSNTVKSTIVQPRNLSTSKLFVIKSGLSANDVIVTAGMSKLRNGMKIIPQPVNADSLYRVLSGKNQQKASLKFKNSQN